jgi:hypothetical protein
MSSLALGSTQPLIQWIPGALFLGVKWPGCEADHSPHLVPRSRMHGAVPLLPNVLSWHGTKLRKKKMHRDYFTFTLPSVTQFGDCGLGFPPF